MILTDLHIHSLLSPCADASMTPEALVGAAVKSGRQLIALTDHNTTKNCPAAAAAAARMGIGFLPGIEVTTLEEIHCVCLFPSLGSAVAFSRWLDSLRAAPVYPKTAGRGAAPRKLDRAAQERQALIVSRNISLVDLPAAVERSGGLFWPAHVDKPYNSLFAVLGGWPEDLHADAAEPFFDAAPPGVPENVKLLRSSNAHHLWDLERPGFPLPLETPDFDGLRRYFKG